jgi:Lrp/AsnC family transcriptional regulator
LQKFRVIVENHSRIFIFPKYACSTTATGASFATFRTTPPNPSPGAGRGAGLPLADLLQAAGAAEGNGVLKGQRATINWAALGYTVEVSLRITLDKTEPRAFDEFLAAAREVPEVTEIQTFLGRVDARLP